MSQLINEYIVDGNAFSDEKGFYDEIERKLTNGLDWKIGRNLNAFNDVLRGGFGEFECEEKIILHWRNIKRSEKLLNKSFYNSVIEIIQEHENVTFKFLNK